VRRDSYQLAALAVMSALLPLLGFEYLSQRPEVDLYIPAPLEHFSIVSAASLLAGVAATATGIAAQRQRNLQLMFLAMAYMSLGFVFALHGLSTPGFLLDVTALPAVTSPLSVVLTAVWMALSTVSTGARGMRWVSRWYSGLVPAWAAVLILLIIVSLAQPHWWETVALLLRPWSGAATAITGALLLWTGMAYWRAYHESGFPLAKAVVYASGWLAVSMWIMVRGALWHLSWWTYHFLLLFATAAVVWGVLRQYAEGHYLSGSVRGLFRADPLARFETAMSDSVRALVLATEIRDPYTAGHSYRVTLTALRIGEAMGLSREQLRALAQGGLVHDVGKIRVPDHILNKPGPLTPEERRIIEEHPITGYEMCSRLGFMPDELAVIRHHHERWDGTGYPDGLKGEEIPLLARILAVADVYDALTSRRAYREPWTHEQAREYVLAGAGTQFDPRCAAVWAQLTADGPPEYVAKAPVRLQEAAE